MKGTIWAGVLALIFLLSGCRSGVVPDDPGSLQVVASFYPVWVMAANVAENVPGVELTLLTEENTGCLHNYQLLPRDMKLLDGADILLTNGAGMEGFLEEAAATFDELKLVDTSQGARLLSGTECEHEHHGHDHSVNSHLWLDVDNAMVQTRNIAAALGEAMPERAADFSANAEDYCRRLEELRAEMAGLLEPLAGAHLVTSHNSFDYLAHAFDLHVATVIQPDEETDPSAAQLGAVCDLMEEENIRVVFVEPDTTGSAAATIAREVGAQLVTLDPITTGERDPRAYEKAQRANAEKIAEVLS